MHADAGNGNLIAQRCLLGALHQLSVTAAAVDGCTVPMPDPYWITFLAYIHTATRCCGTEPPGTGKVPFAAET